MEKYDRQKIIGYKLLKLLLEENKKKEKIEVDDLFYGILKEKADLLDFIEMSKKDIIPVIKNRINLLLSTNNNIPSVVEKFDDEEIRELKYILKDFHRVHNDWFYFYKRLIEEDEKEHCVIRHVVILDIDKFLKTVNKIISLLYLTIELNSYNKTISDKAYSKYMERVEYIEKIYDMLNEEVNNDVASLIDMLEINTL